MSKVEVEFRKIITREQVQAERTTLFVFGDNLQRRGFGGQAAAMRGEWNTVGVPTKRTPTMDPNAFFSDQSDEVFAVLFGLSKITNHLKMDSFDKLVWPMDGIGSGLAKLSEHSPYIWDMIQTYQNWLRKYTTL